MLIDKGDDVPLFLADRVFYLFCNDFGRFCFDAFGAIFYLAICLCDLCGFETCATMAPLAVNVSTGS